MSSLLCYYLEGGYSSLCPVVSALSPCDTYSGKVRHGLKLVCEELFLSHRKAAPVWVAGLPTFSRTNSKAILSFILAEEEMHLGCGCLGGHILSWRAVRDCQQPVGHQSDPVAVGVWACREH